MIAECPNNGTSVFLKRFQYISQCSWKQGVDDVATSYSLWIKRWMSISFAVLIEISLGSPRSLFISNYHIQNMYCSKVLKINNEKHFTDVHVSHFFNVSKFKRSYGSLGSCTVLPFSKLNKIFLGCFDPENILLDNENNFFSGRPNR